MKPKYPYALYLDSKILGTAEQLISFYQQGVFSAENTIIYLKKYKETARKFSRFFTAQGIPFKFMKPRELDTLSGQTIFYAFNAQSNCRFVANRKLKHIFITHGESNKVSSIKPIIRIYDHVVMAGELSLERYYKSGIFDEHDYEIGRLIMMGDTFIGHTGFNHDSRKTNVLFYAPTWEGGIESENYSSLQNLDLVYSSILSLTVKLNLKSIVVQSHPNIGHRDIKIKQSLIKLLESLRKDGYRVYFKSNNISLSWIEKLYLKHKGVQLVNQLNDFYPAHALVDISAMESQCLSENIPYNIFYSGRNIRNDIPEDYLRLYREVGISLHSDILEKVNIDYDFNVMRNKLISYSQDHWCDLSASKRISEVLTKVNSSGQHGCR